MVRKFLPKILEMEWAVLANCQKCFNDCDQKTVNSATSVSSTVSGMDDEDRTKSISKTLETE